MSDKIVAVVNPTAGGGKCGRLWPEIDRQLKERGLSVAACFTEKKGDATRLAREAVASGAERVLAVGGDGTLSEVVNGLRQSSVTLGVIPAGSGNDFVRSLGFHPGDWRKACQIVASGRTQAIDVGQINDRLFINVAGVGFDAAVAERANSWAKQHFPDKIAYLVALLKEITEFRPTELTVELDDQTYSGKGWLVAVGNAQYFGGGMRVTPLAVTDDGLFDVCIIGDVSLLGFLRAFPSVYVGKHLRHPAVHYVRSRTVKVSSANELPVQADGELIGRTPQQFVIRPRTLLLNVE